MRKLNKDNLRKTIYYLKKNGLKNTFLAAAERLQKKYDTYTYEAPDEQTLQAQREQVWENPKIFSVVVPLFHTPEQYFCEMVESVLNQTYPYFELVLADASADERLRFLAEKYGDARIHYIKLKENAGIAENTNQAILAATGDYIVLFDHDDLLTPDALYEMADALSETVVTAKETAYPWSENGTAEKEAAYESEQTVRDVILLYSDEDKCDGTGSIFYDPNYKKDYNRDLLLTNNYFCHLTAVRADVAKRLLLRKEYDGAQDFDFVLRVTAEAAAENIVHIPKILYHWRCHMGSTASNPESKRYAYEAGKRAVENYVNKKGWKAEVTHLKHLGFYRVNYQSNIFDSRSDIGAVGGRILGKRGTASFIPGVMRIVGGMMDEAGNVEFHGLPDGFSGYVNRAVLQQQAEALDIRCMRVNPVCREIVEQVCRNHDVQCTVQHEKQGQEAYGGERKHAPVLAIGEDGRIEWKSLSKEIDLKKLSLDVSLALRNAGYVLLWDPQMVEKIRSNRNANRQLP